MTRSDISCISDCWTCINISCFPFLCCCSSPASRIVYNNGKRNSSPRSPTNSGELFTPAHEENVRFIYEAWQYVERELRSQMSGNERGPVQYVEKNPNPSLNSEFFLSSV
uniref:MAPK regulated corepressor interacting protein 1 n=1 Tax=Latimeria chalumnae TaxID=7897 RepID=H3B2Y0_LATCH